MVIYKTENKINEEENYDFQRKKAIADRGL